MIYCSVDGFYIECIMGFHVVDIMNTDEVM